MSLATDSTEAPWKAGLNGAKANLVPGLILQAFALGMVVSYYQVPALRDQLESLSGWRDRWGILFPIATTGFAGGLLPFLLLKASSATRHRYTVFQGLALTAFWAFKGFEIDTLYHVLTQAIGGGKEVWVVLTKMFLDMFVWCPLVAIPMTTVVYDWTESHFNHRALIADWRRGGWYRRRVLPILISNLGVWVPTVCLIYSLPTPLQLPLQNIVLCFFTLMIAHMTARRRPTELQGPSGSHPVSP